MSEPARDQRHLKPVDDEVDPILVHPETGERIGVLSERTGELEDQLDGAQTEIRSWRTRYANLKRDKEAEAAKDPLWPAAIELFKLWQELCGHPRSAWSAARFEQVRPFLDKHGSEICAKAIRGAAFEPFCTRRKNGTVKRHDGWGLIFRTTDPDKFEEFVNRAPSPQPKEENDA